MLHTVNITTHGKFLKAPELSLIVPPPFNPAVLLVSIMLKSCGCTCTQKCSHAHSCVLCLTLSLSPMPCAWFFFFQKIHTTFPNCGMTYPLSCLSKFLIVLHGFIEIPLFLKSLLWRLLWKSHSSWGSVFLQWAFIMVPFTTLYLIGSCDYLFPHLFSYHLEESLSDCGSPAVWD